MVLVSFPHNPTTHCVEKPFFENLVALAHKHGTMIVHDFAYADLCFEGYRAPSILEVPGAKDVAVEIFSMSKSFNMAGWRVGYCLGNAKMIAALGRIKSYLDYGVFQPIQIASIIALRECEEDTAKIRSTYLKRRDVLVAGLHRAGWMVEAPKATMFVWAQIPRKTPLGGIARVFEATATEGAGRRLARRRLRSRGRRLCSFCARRERTPHAPGNARHQEATERLVHRSPPERNWLGQG